MRPPAFTLSNSGPRWPRWCWRASRRGSACRRVDDRTEDTAHEGRPCVCGLRRSDLVRHAVCGGQRRFWAAPGGVSVTVLDRESLHVRNEVEIGRLTAELSDRFGDVAPDTVEQAVRAAFSRRSDVPIQDFVPIFVERSIRRALRAEHAAA